MGLFNLNKNSADGKQAEVKNIGDITSQKKSEIIKQLSGGKVNQSKRIADNIIVFGGASGGTGVSTIVSNVAYLASTKYNMRVLVIDLNISFPIQHYYFGVEQVLDKKDLVSYLLGENDLSESIDQTNYASLLFANNRGINDEVKCEDDIAADNMSAALDGLRNYYDLILIDCPMRVDKLICNVAMHRADRIYLVWDESLGSIANTDRLRRCMSFTGINGYTKIKAIMNKRTSIQYSNEPFKKMNIPLVEVIPFESEVIFSELNADIFCNKGSTRSKAAAYFCGALEELTLKILEEGGFVNGPKATT